MLISNSKTRWAQFRTGPGQKPAETGRPDIIIIINIIVIVVVIVIIILIGTALRWRSTHPEAAPPFFLRGQKGGNAREFANFNFFPKM